MAFGFPWQIAFISGAGFVLTSTAIREKKQQDAPEWIQLIDQLSEALREPAASHSALGKSRVLALSGSLRQASFNTALAHAARALAPHGMEVEVATLHGIPLYDGDVETGDGIPEAVHALKARILHADGKALFARRPTGLLGASMGGFGTLSSQTAWLPTLKMLGVNLYSGGAVLVSRAQNAFDAQGGLTDAAGQKNLAAYLAGFQEFVLQGQGR